MHLVMDPTMILALDLYHSLGFHFLFRVSCAFEVYFQNRGKIKCWFIA